MGAPGTTDAEAAIIEANNSLYGSQGFFLSVNGGEPDKYHLSRPIEELKARANREWRRAEALNLENAALREALESIRLYANDTLSGRVDGPDDRDWQRGAVVELRNRARAALAAARGESGR